MRSWQLGINIAGLILGIAVILMASQLTVMDAAGPGGGFFPICIGILLMVSSGAMLIRGEEEPASGRFLPPRPALLRIIMVLLALCVLAILMPRIGFLPAAIFTMLILLPAVERRSWLATALLAVAASVIIHGLFAYLLDVSLPRGPLGI